MTNASRCGPLLQGVFACLALTALSVQAADISAYSAAKGRLYSQPSAGAPAPQLVPFVFRATVEGNLAAITGATVRPPSAFAGTLEIEPNGLGTRLEISVPFPDLNTMGFLFGNGDYQFTFDTDDGDFNLAQLTLNSTAFPTVIPQISNFAEAQMVNAGAAFTLNWNGLGDAGGWALIISDSETEVLVETGTGTSVTIPAGTLATDTTHTARLRFFKELDRDEQAVAGAVGTAELFNETEFTIETGEGGGGGDDTNPPFLFTVAPNINATGVPIDSSVTFSFSEAMAPTQSIEWSANLNAANFSYAWVDGGRTLVASYSQDLPANAAITWRLNPNPANPQNFKDLAGNLLPPMAFQGTFVTGSSTGGPNDPCDPNGSGDGRGGRTFVQESAFCSDRKRHARAERGSSGHVLGLLSRGQQSDHHVGFALGRRWQQDLSRVVRIIFSERELRLGSRA